MPGVHRLPMPSPSFPTHTPSPYITIPYGITPTPSPSHTHSPTQSPPTLYPNTLPATPSPTTHHHHTLAPTPSSLSKDPVHLHPVDMLRLPGVLRIPCSHQKPGCPIEYPAVAGRREGRESRTVCVQESGAEDTLCPASTHCPSGSAAQPAQDTSP